MDAAPKKMIRRASPLSPCLPPSRRVVAVPRPAAAYELTAADTAVQRSEPYREGQRALDEESWEEASRIFGEVAAARGDEADAALYWKAYADWKRQRRRSRSRGCGSCWLRLPAKSRGSTTRKALELEIRGGKATRGAPPRSQDEELKLYALDGLMQMEPEKAVPVLEKLLAGRNSLERSSSARSSCSPRAIRRARGRSCSAPRRPANPSSCAVEAVQTLGIAGEPEDIAALA